MQKFKSKKTLTIVFTSIMLCLLTMSVCALNSPSAFAASPKQIAYCGFYFYHHMSIIVRPTSINPNGTITITGQCFSPNGPVTIETSNEAPDTITADEQGNITDEITAPATPGTYRVTAEDMDTADYAEATYTVAGAAVHPHISVSPTEVNPHTQANFTINGTNFTADTLVTFTIANNVSVTPSSTTTNAYGKFGISVSATFINPGKYTITAVDGATSHAASTILTVL